MGKYTVTSLNTTDGKRYILLFNRRVSLSYRTYYKKESNAQRVADRLNKH